MSLLGCVLCELDVSIQRRTSKSRTAHLFVEERGEIDGKGWVGGVGQGGGSCLGLVVLG